MTRKQMLRKIKVQLSKTGFPYNTEGYVIWLEFISKKNSAYSITIEFEVLDEDTFEVFCAVSNPGHKTMDTLVDYIFKHQTQYNSVGVTDDLKAICLIKAMTFECIEEIEGLIIDTLLEVFPYITEI